MKVAVFTNLYKNYSSKHFLSTIKKLRNKSIDVFIDEKSIENMGQKKLWGEKKPGWGPKLTSFLTKILHFRQVL